MIEKGLEELLEEVVNPSRCELEALGVVLCKQPHADMYWYLTDGGAYTFGLVALGAEPEFDIFCYKKFYPRSQRHFQHYINIK